MLTCGELLVALLEEFGVDTVFGIPGVHNVELYRGLPATRIRHVTPRHEQAAGFMADGYARVSGKPGVCFIITGPGVTNITTAMAQAYGDSIPMLVISSVNHTGQLGMAGGRLHELPSQRSLSAGVTAFSHTLMRPDELPAVLTRAFTVFASTRPRPVHIEIPIDVIGASADHVDRKLGAIPSRAAPCPISISRAVQVLNNAPRIVVFLGGGAIDASEEARQLVEALDAPTACTINAKGILPKNHPLSLGSNTSWLPVRELVRSADAVLAIGTELGETDYDLVFDSSLHIPCPLIRVDIDPQQINTNFLAAVGIVSDAKLAIELLLARIDKRGANSQETPGAKLTAAVRDRLEAQWLPAWRVQRRVLEAIQTALPEVIIVGDSTQPVYSGNHMYEANQTRSWFNSATGYGALGYGLPAAVGAKLASPSRPVVALLGDGGLQFTLSEWASAVEARAPVITLLWNNDGYGEIKRYMQERNIPPIGVDIYTPDFLAIARGFGCIAERASSFDHLRELLQKAASAERPTLIEVREDAEFLKV